jgi:hypothetical protein
MRRVIVAGAALLLAVSSAEAQDPRPISFMVGGALSAPTGDAGDVLDMGWFLHGGVRVQPAAWPVGLRFDLGYGRNGVSDVDDVDFNQITLGANVLYDIPVGPTAPVTPGIIGGIWYVGSAFGYGDDYNGPDDDDREWDFGISIGGTLGFGSQTARVRPSAEVRYVTVSTEGDSNYNYFLLGVNLNIR